MRIPGSDRAYVDPAKVRDYLLSPEHPIGRFKARTFAAIGYTQEHWRQLQLDLQSIPGVSDATTVAKTEFGQNYQIDMRLRGPNGREGLYVTIWIVKRNEDFPRLVTAYPAR